MGDHPRIFQLVVRDIFCADQKERGTKIAYKLGERPSPFVNKKTFQVAKNLKGLSKISLLPYSILNVITGVSD